MKIKMPTQAELAVYREKSVTGSFIGKNQLASVFLALDAANNRADQAEAKLNKVEEVLTMAETTFGPRTVPGLERILAAKALINAMREAGYAVDPA